jgi:hypothetical protein
LYLSELDKESIIILFKFRSTEVWKFWKFWNHKVTKATKLNEVSVLLSVVCVFVVQLIIFKTKVEVCDATKML